MTIDGRRSIEDILSLSPEERRSYVAPIHNVTIDDKVFTNYQAFSFCWIKTLKEEPSRGDDGSIPDLDNYVWFLTPQLKINFSLLSIDDYRALMKMIYSKNAFTVKCYDIVYEVETENQMYFAPEEMPKLYAITEALNSAPTLIGVQDYVVEMIGTNIPI